MKKGSNTISSIIKGNTIIQKIYKGLLTVYEGFKKILVSGIPPVTLSKSVGQDLIDYKLYGNSIQDGEPSPTAPIEIQSVGNYDETTGKYKVPVKVTGLNLLDKNKLLNGYIKSDGTIESVSWYYCTDFMEVSGDYLTYSNCASTSATVRFYAFYDKDKNFISGSIQNTDEEGNSSYVVSIPSNAKYFRCNVSSGKIDIAMVYLGDTEQEYVDYVEPITTNIYLDEPLRKIDEYQDYIDFINQKVVRNIKEKKLLSTDEWRTYDYNKHGIVPFNLTLSDVGLSRYGHSICSHYKNDKGAIWALNKVDLYSDHPDGTSYYFNTTMTTLDEWKQFLDNNELVLDYILETPIEETIELPNIPTLKGTTILSVDTEIQTTFMEVIYKGNGEPQTLDIEANDTLNSLLSTDTETELDITTTDINNILDDIIGG